MYIVLFLTIYVAGSSVALRHNEPQCTCSKFHYEEQLLEKMVRMEFAVEKMKNEMEEVRQSVLKTMEEFHGMKKSQEGKIPIAFTARLSDHMYKLGNDQAVVFDNILTNIGNAYSGTSGVFTAPHNGVYYFLATVMSHSGQFLQTEIVKNGQSMVKMFSLDKSHEQGASGVVLQLETSDEVWVRHIKTEGENVYGHYWSSFSGFLITN